MSASFRLCAYVAATLCVSIGSALAQGGSLIVTQEEKIVPADAASGDLFGNAVAIQGDTVLVSSPFDDDNGTNSGSVYVFTRTGNDWNQTAKIKPADGTAGDAFGISVAFDSGTAVIGASGDDDLGPNAGSIYVFSQDGTSWIQDIKLNAGDADANDQFGGAVSIDADTIVAGATMNDDSGLASGAAYVFERRNGNWIQTVKFLPNDLSANDQFGISVTAQGDFVIVGASGGEASLTATGAAYVFERVGTVWAFDQKLLAGDATIGDQFGASVHLDGDTAIVGALENDDAGSASGSVYVYVLRDGLWTQQAKLLSSDGAIGDAFGASLDIEGDRVLVGSPGDDDSGPGSGSAYAYTRVGTVWSEDAKFIAFEGAAEDRFGFSVSFSGLDAFIGARFDDHGTNDVGSAYIFSMEESLFDSFCFGDGGDQAGCTDCPCGNDAPQGAPGGCLNSNNTSAFLIPDGIPSIASDTLKFDLRACIPNTFALLFAADEALPQMGPCPPGSGIAPPVFDGLRCAGINLIRHQVRPVNSFGHNTNPWGFDGLFPHSLAVEGGYGAGQTRNFQCVYRELAGTVCMTGQNTTNAIEVVYMP